MRRTLHRADANHWDILRALKAVTKVYDLHNYGHGMGDILAKHVRTGLPVFLEVKAKQSDKLTEAESAFAAVFKSVGAWRCVHSEDEAMAAVGIETKGAQ